MRIAWFGFLVFVGFCCVAEGDVANAQMRSFKCQQEPLPEFTLGPKSNPTAEQLAQLCQCIWRELGTWEKRVATSISKGEKPTEPLPSPELNIRAFVERMGTAMSKCGGYSY